MKNIFGVIKIGLGLLPSRLFRFIKKLLVNLVVYTCASLIPILIAFVVMYLVITFAQNTNAAGIVFKILATTGQIIPLSFSLYISEHELIEADEDSAELCFAICALVIAALWIKF